MVCKKKTLKYYTYFRNNFFILFTEKLQMHNWSADFFIL